MKNTILSSSLFLSLILGASGEDRALLLSQISLKEEQVSKIQKEIDLLRNQLSKAPSPKSSYTVVAGDTIHSIARAHKVSPSDLMTWNQITDPTRLGVGEVLVITRKAPSAGTKAVEKTSVPATSSYTVAKGDTFYSIARRHRLTLKQLKALNPDVGTHLIAPGQKIVVSGTAIAAPAQAQTKIFKIKKPAPRTIAIKNTAPAKTLPKPKVTKKTVDAPKPTPKPVVKKTTPPAPPVVEETLPKSNIATLYLEEEITFEQFAEKYGTTTEQLNELNGWNLPKATVLARGSEIQYPK